MSEYLIIKIQSKDKHLIQSFCKNRREDVSGFVRRIVLAELARHSYLSDSEKKALGVLVR